MNKKDNITINNNKKNKDNEMIDNDINKKNNDSPGRSNKIRNINIMNQGLDEHKSNNNKEEHNCNDDNKDGGNDGWLGQHLLCVGLGPFANPYFCSEDLGIVFV